MKIETEWEWYFDLMNEAGHIFAEDIFFKGTLSGEYYPPDPSVGHRGGFADLRVTDLRINSVTREGTRKIWEGWEPMPSDLRPYFIRWFESGRGNQEYVLEETRLSMLQDYREEH